LRTSFSSIVGPGHARVQVAADMDFNRVTETAETFDPDSKVVRSSQTVQQDSASKDNRAAAAVSVGTAIPGQRHRLPRRADNASVSNNTRNEETINYEIFPRPQKRRRWMPDKSRNCPSPWWWTVPIRPVRTAHAPTPPAAAMT